MTIQALMPRQAPSRPANTPAADGPDLVVERVDSTPAFPYAGDAVYFDVIVKNRGNQPAGPFEVELSSTGMLQNARAQGLAAGAQVAFRSMGPLWTHYGDQILWVDANVDTRHEVTETNEANNWLTTSVSVQDPFPPGPPGPPGPYPPYPPYPHR